MARRATSSDTAARFLLVHRRLGLAALGGGAIAPRLSTAAALVLSAGPALFCGDLIRRALAAGSALFPYRGPGRRASS